MVKSKNSASSEKRKRLNALYRYETLDHIPEQDPVFDRLAALAAQICNVPISYIKLITDDKQYVKASYGIERDDKPGSLGICQYTILQDDILEIRDSYDHELFKKNPKLHGQKNLRFYAGVPLITPDGFKIGTLCLIDTKPGVLSDSQKEALRTLADEIMSRYELNLTRNELKKKNDEKDELIKIVSHDIRNPLAGIISYSELLKEELKDEYFLEMVGNIEKGSESILSIINLMLDSEYVRNQAFIIRNEKVDAEEVTSNVIELYKKMVLRKDQKLDIRMDKQIKANLDSDKWKQIVGNLLNNAIRFTDRGGTISVHLTKTETTKTLLELTITDTGIGIPEQILDDIYSGKESIIRKDTEGKKSSGFGMFLSKKYVSLMKGMINITSKVDVGTEIKVRIPI
ncbi:MAG: GAF domain-containing sensor histidine kinase [Balneolaceae bacterium]